MKYFSIFCVCFMLFLSSGYAQWQQYFDGADTMYYSLQVEIRDPEANTWQIGPPQKNIFSSASTLPNAMVTDTINDYPINDTSRFYVSYPLSESEYGILAFQWKQKLDLDTAMDGGLIEYSLDSGETWISVFNNPYVYNFYGFDDENVDTLPGGEIAFTGTDGSWRDIWLCFDYSWLNNYWYMDSMRFRFTLVSDSIEKFKEGWMIDNMVIHPTFIHTINEVPQEKYMQVYPNPASDIVYIEIRKIMEYHIIESMELIDQFGRLVDSWSFVPTKFWFATKPYVNGMYFIRVKTNIQTEVTPIVINNH